MGLESPVGTSQEVFRSAILTVGHDGLHQQGSVLLVLLDQSKELAIFSHRAAGGLLGRNHSLSIIYHTMLFIAQARRSVTPTCQLGLRIRRASVTSLPWPNSLVTGSGSSSLSRFIPR